MVSDSTGSAARLTLQNMLTEVPLFAGFPEELIEGLQHAATVVHFDPDQAILKQGELNKSLFFLVIGTVDIFVDGGLVASLRRKGDLLGEMSVITSKPCSATIIARTPVRLICINLEEFKKILGDNKDRFDHILYRIYSQILADKVNVTNQRAKTVEAMLEALERAKSELMEINSQMERRVVERTQSLQTKLQEFLNQHLRSLQDSLKEASAKVGADIKPAIEKNVDKVEEVVRFLEPLVQRFNVEVSMKNKRVLLAQKERKFQTISKMALGGTGVFIDVAASTDEARTKIITEKYDVVLADGLELIETVQNLKPCPKLVYMASKGIQDTLPLLMQLTHHPNIVLFHEEDRISSIRTIMTTVIKLCSPSIFGLEKYLNVGVEVQELQICRSSERQELNEKMKAYFTKLGVRSSALDNVGLVLEELLMNAIYDAPTDASGYPLYNGLSRNTPVELKASERGQFRFAMDGSWLVISVQDPFGALTAKTIVNYLDSCYGQRAGTLQEHKGGAGRGLHQVVEGSTCVVFNVHPRRQTEVIAFFDIMPRAKNEVTVPLLHYFVQT